MLPVTTEASERRQGVNLETTLYSESQQSRRPEYYHSQICLTQTMPTSPFYWGQEQRQLITPNVSLVPPVRWSSLIFVIRGVDTFLLISSCTFSLSSSSLSLQWGIHKGLRPLSLTFLPHDYPSYRVYMQNPMDNTDTASVLL